MNTITLTDSDILLIKKLQVLKSLCSKTKDSCTKDTPTCDNEVYYTLVPRPVPKSCASTSLVNVEDFGQNTSDKQYEYSNSGIKPDSDRECFFSENERKTSNTSVTSTSSSSTCTSELAEKLHSLTSLHSSLGTNPISSVSSYPKSSISWDSGKGKDTPYTYQQFCQNLDVSDYSTLRALEFLIQQTKPKVTNYSVPSAPDRCEVVEPNLATLADGLRARAKAYRETLALESKCAETAETTTQLKSRPVMKDLNIQNTQNCAKPVVDDYFLHKSPPIITDLPSGFYHNGGSVQGQYGGDEDNDLNFIPLDAPLTDEANNQLSSVCVSSNKVLVDKPAGLNTDVSHHKTKAALGSKDVVDLGPIAAVAESLISQPFACQETSLTNVQSILSCSVTTVLTNTAQQSCALPKPGLAAEQGMASSNGKPSSSDSGSCISLLSPTPPSSQPDEHAGSFVYTEQLSSRFEAMGPLDRGPVYQPSSHAVDLRNGTEGNYTTSVRQTRDTQKAALDDSPPVYRESLDSSPSLSPVSGMGYKTEYQSVNGSHMSVSRRGSMWDTFDDPLMEGLVVQEIDGVSPGSWNS